MPTPGVVVEDNRWMPPQQSPRSGGNPSAGDAQPLPVEAHIPAISEALGSMGSVVLVAPPGTGKTTMVPPGLLSAPWLGEQMILMVEPRRLAARTAAARMAANAGEALGEPFGYRVRHDRRTSRRTRVEVVTEGIFARRIQNDPELSGVGLVVLDEFHERSLESDVALAFLLEARESLRPELRIMVMSATIDADRIAAHLGAAEVIEVESPLHPVQTLYRPPSGHPRSDEHLCEVVTEALRDQPGDVLVFLPGRAEIRRAAEALGRIERTRGLVAQVVQLHGSISAREQDQILDPPPEGPRRVILATSIAETSVTIPGVRVVIDSGRRRTGSTDPRTGLPYLATTAVDLAGADQRRGRAGRTAPGTCYRLWSRNDEHLRPQHPEPEIASADLAPMLLQARSWGANDPLDLPWLDPPPAHALERAADLLRDLGALDAAGRLTARGKAIAALGFHPRIGAIATEAGRQHAALAAEICALLETGGAGDIELSERIRAIHTSSGPKAGTGAELRQSLKQWRRTLDVANSDALGSPHAPVESLSESAFNDLVGRIVAAGFADRLAKRRPVRVAGPRKARKSSIVAPERQRIVYQLRHGGEVELPDHRSPMAQHEWIIAIDLDSASGAGRPGRLYFGATMATADALALVEPEVVEQAAVSIDDRSRITAERVRRVDAITIGRSQWSDAPTEAINSAVLAEIRGRGCSWLPRWHEADGLRSRLAFLVAQGFDPGLDPDEAALTETVDAWLGPRLSALRAGTALDSIDVSAALWDQIDWPTRQLLDAESPRVWTAPTGAEVPLRYGAVDADPASVLMQVRLQKLLGFDDHPTIGTRRIPITVELTSPANRPLQRTQDLPGFWRGSYAQVRAEMRSRYRKHDWPERPWEPRPKP